MTAPRASSGNLADRGATQPSTGAGRPTAAAFWQALGTRFLPFADAASADLPLARILRLALFQVTVGVAAVLLNGTLNRVLIVELGTPTWIVALMIAIPLMVAPFRALIGYRSDVHRSFLGWRRVPYMWFGTLAQFGGLAIMPFALILITREDTFVLGVSAACLSFLLTGGGMHVTQTAGLALATDLAPPERRSRVVALLYVMLLVGMMLAALVLGSLLRDFSATKLVQVIQGAAVLTISLNIIALWKQEPRGVGRTNMTRTAPPFRTVWRGFAQQAGARRLLVTIGLGAGAFAMQDALLEPYGGAVLGLSVGATTALTALWALGALAAFALGARQLPRGADPLRLAGLGLLVGVAAFCLTLFAGPMQAPLLLFGGALLIGFGLGLFAVGTMMAAMDLARGADAGMALGAWGAVQASCAGLGIALGGIIRDSVNAAAISGGFGMTLAGPGTGYGAVYVLEILLLLATLVALGPLVGAGRGADNRPRPLDLETFPT